MRMLWEEREKNILEEKKEVKSKGKKEREWKKEK
jgi:hypothetical protein